MVLSSEMENHWLHMIFFLFDMKILYVASSCGWGGGSVALFNLIKGLKERGHESMVLFPNGNDKKFCEELDQIGIFYSFADYGLTIYPHTKNPLKYLVRLCRTVIKRNMAQHKILELIKSFKPDIVHTNVGPLDIALSPCIKSHVPHVWHLREYQDKIGMIPIPSKHHFMKKIHKDGNYNIAITRGVFSYWKLNLEKDVVVYDGVFSENYQEISCFKDNIILFVGRVEEAKGVIEIFQPFLRFVKIHPEYKLIIAGKYNENSKYYQQCLDSRKRLNLEHCVKFLGEISNVYEWMAKAKALVVPSWFEGFGFITAEAMLNGCFVIGRDTTGTKEQFDKCFDTTGVECGYRFTDASELFEGLRYAVEHDTSKQCQLAKSVVRENYSLERHCVTVENYYKKILNK